MGIDAGKLDPPKEKLMYIGVGAIVVILVVLLLIGVLR
jgi:hypothetical protein